MSEPLYRVEAAHHAGHVTSLSRDAAEAICEHGPSWAWNNVTWWTYPLAELPAAEATRLVAVLADFSPYPRTTLTWAVVPVDNDNVMA